MSHNEAAKRKEWSGHTKNFRVAGFLEIAIPETHKERLEVSFEAAGALQRKEKIVHRQAGDVVGWLSPFAARPIDDLEFRSLSKQNVPWMKVSVNLAQTMNPALEMPSPLHTALLDIFEA